MMSLSVCGGMMAVYYWMETIILYALGQGYLGMCTSRSTLPPLLLGLCFKETMLTPKFADVSPRRLKVDASKLYDEYFR